MKHFILSSIAVIGLLAAPIAMARESAVDGESEADVAAHSFNPKNDDCKCLGTKAAGVLTDDKAQSRRVAEWVSNQGAQGPAPEISNTGVVREN